MWPADDIRARDIRIWQINFETFLGWQKLEKNERIALTKLYFVYRFVYFDSEKMVF